MCVGGGGIKVDIHNSNYRIVAEKLKLKGKKRIITCNLA